METGHWITHCGHKHYKSMPDKNGQAVQYGDSVKYHVNDDLGNKAKGVGKVSSIADVGWSEKEQKRAVACYVTIDATGEGYGWPLESSEIELLDEPIVFPSIW